MKQPDKFLNILNFQTAWPETFEVTQGLRWFSNKGSSLRLQQMWRGNQGTIEWRDVPEAHVSSEAAR